MLRTALLTLHLCALLSGCHAVCDQKTSYRAIDAFLCINSQFTVSHSFISSAFTCAYLCSGNQRCQAFSLADGPCQLFVFDKCSKSVRDCDCSRRGRLFVKQQAGVDVSAPCPSGYGDDLCGVKYKRHFVRFPSRMTWQEGRQRCESDGGWAIMADVTSASELQHVQNMYNTHIKSIGYMFLGGLQAAGSSEPAGGWSWLPCNIPVDSSVWTSGEPNNILNAENAIGVLGAGLSDIWEEDVLTRGMLCECLSPFN